MATPVLIDGSHFLGRAATGIGSYGRTLAAALRASGCRVAVLYGQRARSRRTRSLRLAAQVFGNEPQRSRRLRLLGEIPFLLRAAVGGLIWVGLLCDVNAETAASFGAWAWCALSSRDRLLQR